jgi:hypothetical protein
MKRRFQHFPPPPPRRRPRPANYLRDRAAAAGKPLLEYILDELNRVGDVKIAVKNLGISRTRLYQIAQERGYMFIIVKQFRLVPMSELDNLEDEPDDDHA